MSVPLQPLALRHDLGDAISGRYLVRDVLGAGAFGTVYRVEETLGSRTVTRACKEMHVLDDPDTDFDERADALRMFQEEAYLLETLRHPHIPAAHFALDRGTWLACPVCGRSFRGSRTCPDHGATLQVIRERYYLLMDFIEGDDLEVTLERQRGRPLDEIPVLDWMLQVCDALETVHKAGFSHRDIKPANIKIQAATKRAMLIDFGLVKPSNVVGGYGTILQRKSTSMGTLGYAPPTVDEQRAPDARTDILALGMTMYRLLTSRDPTEPADLEAMRRSTPHDFNASVSPEVSGIILQMTQADPRRRYANVDEVRRALQAARYPVEVTCPHCGQLNRSASTPQSDARCTRCGRALEAAQTPKRTTTGATGANGTSVIGRTTVLSPVGNRAAAASSAAPSLPLVNPFENRLKQLTLDYQATYVAPPSALDPRIEEINRTLSLVAPMATGVPLDGCPNCQSARLVTAEGQPTGVCPLCRGAQLERRALDAKQCPCCHQAALERGHLPARELFCPVCREVPLREETRRGMLGVMADLWWVCPHCQAEWDEGRHHTAALVKAPYDPYGVGAQHRGITLNFEDWRRMSGRNEEYIACHHCGANWDIPASDTGTLLHTGQSADCESLKGQSKPLDTWAKIAAGLAPDIGTHHCPRCRGEFDVDRGHGAMTVLRFGGARPDWAVRWLGQPHPLREWYLHAEGKTDGQPGLLCPHCACEWDHAPQDTNLYRLTLAKPTASGQPGPLSGRVGEAYALEDWQRVARGVPTRETTVQLRQELTNLQRQRNEEMQRAQYEAESRRNAAETEMTGLLKKSAIEGYIPLLRLGANHATQTGNYVSLARHLPHSALRTGETLRWESAGTFLRYIVNATQQGWLRDGNGTVMVTDSRLLFVLPPNSAARAPGLSPIAWQRNTAQLSQISMQNVQGSQVVVLSFHGDSQVWGFEMSNSVWPLHWEGRVYNLTVAPDDLIAMLHGMMG